MESKSRGEKLLDAGLDRVPSLFAKLTSFNTEAT